MTITNILTYLFGVRLCSAHNLRVFLCSHKNSCCKILSTPSSKDETSPEVENESGSGRNELEVGGGACTSNHHKPGILSPMNAGLLNVDDIDADNLAADFDESFTGTLFINFQVFFNDIFLRN